MCLRLLSVYTNLLTKAYFIPFQAISARPYDTWSDNEVDEVSSVMADSQKSINFVETRRNNLEKGGFVKDDHIHEYVSKI